MTARDTFDQKLAELEGAAQVLQEAAAFRERTGFACPPVLLSNFALRLAQACCDLAEAGVKLAEGDDDEPFQLGKFSTIERPTKPL